MGPLGNYVFLPHLRNQIAVFVASYFTFINDISIMITHLIYLHIYEKTSKERHDARVKRASCEDGY